MLKKIAFGLFAVCLMTPSSLAQNSDKAKESYDKAIKMINKGKFTGVPALLVEAVSLESKHETRIAFLSEKFSACMLVFS